MIYRLWPHQPCNYTAKVQLGRTANLEAGAGVLMTNAEIGSMQLAAASRFITFRVPCKARPIEALLLTTGRRRGAVFRPITRRSSCSSIISDNARDTRALTTPALQQLAVTHIHDLLALALGATRRDAAEIAQYSRGMRAARLRAAKAFIERYSGRPELSIKSVAAYLGTYITPRYVHMLFATDRSSFTEFLIEQRLNCAYQMLIDPQMTGRTISLIAFAAGFSDLSHFNRTFRRRFGRTPSEAR